MEPADVALLPLEAMKRIAVLIVEGEDWLRRRGRWREGAPPSRQNSPPQLQGSLSPQSIPPQTKASPCHGLLKLCKCNIHIRTIASIFFFFFLKKRAKI